MGKYDALRDHLQRSNEVELDLSFGDVERIIGRALPPSALRHRGFWSNNPDNNVMTRAWLEAGYRTANVDMTWRRVTFEVATGTAPASAPRPSARHVVADRAGAVFIDDAPRDARDVLAGLSSGARAWLQAKGDTEMDRNRAIVKAVEAMAAKDRRLALLAKYEKAGLGAGSDSVDLIREDRDGR